MLKGGLEIGALANTREQVSTPPCFLKGREAHWQRTGTAKCEVTSVAFRRIMINWSARCIKKRVNLWQSTSSISSACLIMMLTRTELTEGSMRHFSR